MPRQLVQTAGEEQTNAVLSEVYGRVMVAFPSPSGGMRIERDLVGAATLDRIRMDFGATFEVNPASVITIVRVRRGSLRVTSGRVEDTIGVGDLRVPADPTRPYLAVDSHLEHDVTTLPDGLFDEVASTSPGPDGAPVRLTGWHPVSTSATAQFNRTRAHVLQVAHATDEVPAWSTRLLHGSLGRLLAGSILVTFPSTAMLDPTHIDRHDAHPASLRRAVTYIQANPDLDVSVADIARAAHVSVRALQLAFRRHLNTTPLRYLRRVRLDLARADLQAATSGDGTTVTEVAMRWGYVTLSRFAVDYRDAYGEHPHVTLRR